MRDLSGNTELLKPVRDAMVPAAKRSDLPYDLSALTPCANRTPAALAY